LCTDNTQTAIASTNHNFKANISEWNDFFSVENANVYPLKEKKFSLIVSFPPFIPVNKIITEDEYGYCDRHEKFLTRLIKESHKYLDYSGKMIILYPNLAEVLNISERNKIQSLCDSNNLTIENVIDADDIQISKMSVHTRFLRRFDDNTKMSLYILSKK